MNALFIFYGIGSAIFLFGAYRVMLGYLSLSWPTVPGEIIFSKVETRHSGGRGGGGTSATIRLKYRYSVSGREYTGNRFCFGSGSAHSYAIAMQDLVQQTTNFSVAYCRSRPSLSVAKPGIQQESVTFMLLGFGLLLSVLYFQQV